MSVLGERSVAKYRLEPLGPVQDLQLRPRFARLRLHFRGPGPLGGIIRDKY